MQGILLFLEPAFFLLALQFYQTNQKYHQHFQMLFILVYFQIQIDI
jgi:hypothetical protein